MKYLFASSATIADSWRLLPARVVALFLVLLMCGGGASAYR
jgi:hypothetical protein